MRRGGGDGGSATGVLSCRVRFAKGHQGPGGSPRLPPLCAPVWLARGCSSCIAALGKMDAHGPVGSCGARLEVTVPFGDHDGRIRELRTGQSRAFSDAGSVASLPPCTHAHASWSAQPILSLLSLCRLGPRPRLSFPRHKIPLSCRLLPRARTNRGRQLRLPRVGILMPWLPRRCRRLSRGPCATYATLARQPGCETTARRPHWRSAWRSAQTRAKQTWCPTVARTTLLRLLQLRRDARTPSLPQRRAHKPHRSPRTSLGGHKA